MDGTAVLIKYTLAGDANLDARVDISDLATLATHWHSGASWIGGDFTYDGMVDAADLATLATNWQRATAAPVVRSSNDPVSTVSTRAPSRIVAVTAALHDPARRQRSPGQRAALLWAPPVILRDEAGTLPCSPSRFPRSSAAAAVMCCLV